MTAETTPPAKRIGRWLDLAVSCALGVTLAVGGAQIASRRAPSAAAQTPVPPASSASVVVPTGPRADEVEEVAIRLTDELGTATLEAPNVQRGLTDLAIHWRRMQAPWAVRPKQTDRARLLQLVALRTSEKETKYTVQLKDGNTATFDVRRWNLDEGSYEQRESIVAPTPSTLRFRLRVPSGGALEVAPAVLGVADAAPPGPAGEVTFTVIATPLGASAIEVGRVVISEKERNRWMQQRFDLAQFAGKEIDLELRAVHAQKAGVSFPTTTTVAMWGTPQIKRKAPAKLPYSVLWIVIDSLRPDVLASFHDPQADAIKRKAKHPPGDTLLPMIPGLTPNIDALAKRGAVFRRATSGSHWTRPGTVAMLTGVHTAKLGLPVLPWFLPDDALDRFYVSNPPLLALAFRRNAAATRAFVNNNFMLGYASVGVDFGFEHIEDFRYRYRDTAEITKSTLASMRAHKGERTFLFVNYDSPHEPYDNTPECNARIPESVRKKDDPVRFYMGEACKDDMAIGELLAELDKQGMREKTLIVVTADHGETLTSAHDELTPGIDDSHSLYHHAFGMYEETTRIPILLSLPGVIPEGAAIDTRVINLDIAPTILKLEGLDPDPRHEGIDLISLAKGIPAKERPIVTMGRAQDAIFWDRFRFAMRYPPATKVVLGRGANEKQTQIHEQLFDLVDDPGETVDLSGNTAYKGTVAELKARLKAALAGVPTADAPATTSNDGPPPLVHVRYAGGGKAHRVQVRIEAKGATRFEVTPVGLAKEAASTKGTIADIAFSTSADALVGFDLMVAPPTTPVQWTFSYDDKPLPDDAVFGGVLGVTVSGLSRGLSDGAARASVSARALPFIDPQVDFGAFVTRDYGAGDASGIERVKGGAAVEEVKNALKAWGYAK